MDTRSRKAKGRRLQNWVKGKLLSAFPSLTEDDVSGAVMGETGVDIKLSQSAKSIKNDRVILLEGSSTSRETISKIKRYTQGKKGIVILDSDHSEKHVTKELSIYKEFVQKGCYLVVEDTNLNGNPVHPNFGPGPLEAVEKFLTENRDFIQDNQLWKRNLFSFHQHGWLVKSR